MESAIAWVLPRDGRGPQFLRQRRRCRLELTGDELRITRKGSLLGTVAIRPGTLVADQNLITLRRVILRSTNDDSVRPDDTGSPDDAGSTASSPYLFEFGLRSRSFARALADAAA